MNNQRDVVVKVGGSLEDLADLGERLRNWIERLDADRLLLVPGGGSEVRHLRERDRRLGLGEECCHWMALDILTANGSKLRQLLDPLPTMIVADPAEVGRGQTSILDAGAFARRDLGQRGELPHAWEVTSDSIAARAAALGGFGRLLLLKSIAHSGTTDWHDASRRGWVDGYFPRAIDSKVQVEIVPFRLSPRPSA